MHSAALFLVMVKMVGQKKMVTKANISKVVKDVLDSRVEHKRTTSTGVYAQITTTGVVNAITQSIVQGDDISNRSGDTILVESIRLRVVFNDQDPVINDIAFVGRVILFADMQALGTAPAVTDVLASADVLSGYNTPYKQQSRFKIYLDELVGVYNNSVSRYQIVDRIFKVNRKVCYVAASGSSSNGKGSLYALFISDITNTLSRYKWSYDIQYTDS